MLLRELQEEDQVATKRHASKRHSESLQERQERLQRDAQAHTSVHVCLTVCLSTILPLYRPQHGLCAIPKLQCYKAMKNNVAILLKRLRSRDMA